jgi:hypothetical protein
MLARTILFGLFVLAPLVTGACEAGAFDLKLPSVTVPQPDVSHARGPILKPVTPPKITETNTAMRLPEPDRMDGGPLEDAMALPHVRPPAPPANPLVTPVTNSDGAKPDSSAALRLRDEACRALTPNQLARATCCRVAPGTACMWE